MLKKIATSRADDAVTPEEEIKDPYILEFLNLKDEYSESDLEEALIQQLERFLLELGGNFTFVGRQRRLRIGDEWYRVDLLFSHRQLRCLVVIDLKVGKFTHADAGQMHLYLNYAREHWTNKGENPPVGLILCAERNAAVTHYALDGLPNKVMAAEYKMKLPDEKILVAELRRCTKLLESQLHQGGKRKSRNEQNPGLWSPSERFCGSAGSLSDSITYPDPTNVSESNFMRRESSFETRLREQRSKLKINKSVRLVISLSLRLMQKWAAMGSCQMS